MELKSTLTANFFDLTPSQFANLVQGHFGQTPNELVSILPNAEVFRRCAIWSKGHAGAANHPTNLSVVASNDDWTIYHVGSKKDLGVVIAVNANDASWEELEGEVEAGMPEVEFNEYGCLA